MAYISAADSMGLSLFKFLLWVVKKHLFCNGVHIGFSGSSKVVDFGTNRKGLCDFLLVINNTSCACTILRYCELLAENCKFSLPHSHLTPSLGVNPFKFLDEFFIPKTRAHVLSVDEDFVILACVVFTQCQGVTDGRTDGRTDIPTMASTKLAQLRGMLMPCKIDA